MSAAVYCMRGDLSEEMQVNDPLEDGRIDRAILDASRAIDAFARQEPGIFAPQSLTKTFDVTVRGWTDFQITRGAQWQWQGNSAVRAITGLSSQGQILNVPPLLSVTSFATDDDGDGIFETVWSTPTDYLLSPRNLEVKRQVEINQVSGHFSFPYGQNTIQIIGSWGITEGGQTPYAIRRACLQLAMDYYRRPSGVQANSLGGAIVHFDITDPDVAALIWTVAGYRNQWVGA